MRGSEIWFGRGPARMASAVALAGVLVVTLVGCGAERKPTAGPTATGVPEATATATASPTVDVSPTAPAPTGTPSAAAGGSGARDTAKPTKPSPTPSGTPKRPASHDPAKDITDLVPKTTGLRLGRPVAGVRHGELVVTIRNNGPEPVWGLTFAVEVPESMSADGGDWSGCTRLKSSKVGYPAGSQCEKGYLGSGQSRVFRLKMKSPAAKDGADSLISRWLVDVWSAGDDDAPCRDSGPDDNRKFFSVYRG